MKKKNYVKLKNDVDNMIERRQINVSYGKNGQGCITTRISIPKKFFEKIGVTSDNKKVNVTLYNDKIEIRRI